VSGALFAGGRIIHRFLKGNYWKNALMAPAEFLIKSALLALAFPRLRR